MGCVAKFRLLVTSLVLFYSVYLYTYKCPKEHQSALGHAAQVLVHPFSHQHNQLCKGIDTAEQYVAPYCAKAHQFLDAHVHSHHLFKEYKVESKLHGVQAKYYQYVHPLVLQFFAYVEIVEYHVAQQLHALYVFLEGHFHKTVVPKVNELKNTVAAQADAAKDKVKETVASHADAANEKIQSKLE